jgi:hypothetical protein
MVDEGKIVKGRALERRCWVGDGCLLWGRRRGRYVKERGVGSEVVLIDWGSGM